MKSVWSDTSNLPRFPALDRDIKTDVLIIGGGIAGILCAHMLSQAGVKYVLLEADRICSGITANTTAKITSQHGLIYSDLLRRFGRERAGMYLQANELALGEYRKMCKKTECDFEDKDNFVYSKDDHKKLEKEIQALEQIGFSARYTDILPLPFRVSGAVCFAKQAQFNPLKFVSGICRKLNIYEDTHVRSFNGRTFTTDRFKVTADKTIVTTHFPFINKHGSYFLKLYQHRSYVTALEGAPDVYGMYVDEKDTGLSFRNYNGLLLLGGGDHRTGKEGGGWAELTSFAQRHYPHFREKYRWATQDCMSLDSVPYIGLYSKNTPGLYVATGFNKWGMTSSMVAAMILRDMILGEKNDFSPVFSPSRSILRPQLFINAFETASNLLTPSKPRCPHLGCALKWNPHERSWDCPCHGSRFMENGTLLDNPATGNLKHNEN